MSQVRVEFEVVNLLDKTKRITVEGIVDTGATMLCLPRKMIEQLNLEFDREVEVRTTNGKISRRVYKAAEMYIKGRRATIDVVEIGNELPPLIGHVPLELMDFVVYPDKMDIFTNPEHGGEYMIDLL